MRTPPKPDSPLYPSWRERKNSEAYAAECESRYAPTREADSRVRAFLKKIGNLPHIKIRYGDWDQKKPRNDFQGGFRPGVKYKAELMARIATARAESEKIIIENGGRIIPSADNKITAETPEGNIFSFFIA